ncbi:hypothetical protein [Glycomyces artemisiae]|uniref:Concanavalin A-like lectin/glucanase superfamily protein n=1 Tax=Glycomyces artemisiae TaxID=1076443 RepID=A0A2T0UET6_9ACTN|nr:hypothetical protein [Glycomyces artemisiae]PRY56433.1 hypothetical protein B0I28_10982 [Glycomyces artemisiae]
MTIPLQFRIEIALGADINGDPTGWTWTDITDRVLVVDGAKITIRRGRRSDSGAVTAANATFILDNDDGAFETDNPLSPYYPLLDVNTPVQISVSPDSGSSWYARFAGYLTKLPTRWLGAGAAISRITVTAESILRRLSQEDAASPLERTAPALLSGRCLEYWSMQDGQYATQCASHFAGGIPMTVTGSLDLGRSTPPPGSTATAMSDYEFMAARPPSATGTVRPYTNTGAWSVHGIFRIEQEAPFELVLMECDLAKAEGSAQPDKIRLVVDDEVLSLEAYREDDTLLGSMSTGIVASRAPNDGEWHAITVRAAQSGSDVLARIRYEGATYTLTLTGKTLGPIRRVAFPSTRITTAPKTLSVGHLAVYDHELTTVLQDRVAQAMRAYPREQANARIGRTDTESALMYQVQVFSGVSSMVELLGEQPHANSLGILADAAEADGGILFEPADFADGSLRYYSRAFINGLANAAPAVVIPQRILADLDKNDDDYLLSTQVTAAGAGSSVTAAVSPVQNATAISVNVADGDRLPDMAGWALYQGTRKGGRFPSTKVNMHEASTFLMYDWLNSDLGDRIALDDPPPHAGDVDMILEGYTETIDLYDWVLDLYGSPASRYQIADLDDTTRGRMDTAGSRLVNAVTAAATALEVETHEGSEWSTAASGFDVGVGGERMAVTSVAAAFSDTFTRSVSNGWGTSTSGHAWSLTGGLASDYSVNGTRGLISLGAVNSLRSTYIAGLAVADIDRTFTVRVPVIPTGAGIQVRSMVRWDVAVGTYYMPQIQIETSSAVTATIRKSVAGVNTTLRSKVLGVTHTATTDYRLRVRTEGSWIYFKVWTTAQAEPTQWTDAAWDTDITTAGAWGVRAALLTGNTNSLPVVIQVDNDTTANPQRFTVTRAVNNIPKDHSAGAELTLSQPNHLGL